MSREPPHLAQGPVPQMMNDRPTTEEFKVKKKKGQSVPSLFFAQASQSRFPSSFQAFAAVFRQPSQLAFDMLITISAFCLGNYILFSPHHISSPILRRGMT
jgi:hypothetical protein